VLARNRLGLTSIVILSATWIFFAVLSILGLLPVYGPPESADDTFAAPLLQQQGPFPVTAAATASNVPDMPLGRHPGLGVPYLIVCFFLIFALALQKKKRVLAGCAVVVVSVCLASCGAGSNSVLTTPTPPSPTPSPQTVTLAVVASAATTFSDSNNQKTLSPIVITLQ
jgi:hypothetical protein